ncbi:uncharacterized protein LOC142168878 [Nicotiana tabacum]|uniref:Uncharacterized protein LOC142168878 n=1 Tax=Nicotiana tabacum TaxID=4097 RepID=A0AC58SMG1_TOBAC
MDDIVIFCGGNNITISLIKKLIDSYENASGQKVNNDKSFFIIAPHTCDNRINISRNIIGFMDKPFSFIYLGCPIYYGRKTTSLFDRMLSKIVKKLNGWQGNMMSPVGRMILIKHVLQSLSTYMLSAMNPPKVITKLMEKHFTKFFWGLMKFIELRDLFELVYLVIFLFFAAVPLLFVAVTVADF